MDNHRCDTLYDVSSNGHDNCVRTLLHAGAQINDKNNIGMTPLHLASYKGYTNCVRILLDAGADLNLKDDFGWTPPHSVSYNGHNECVLILLDAGADLNLKVNGKTHLDLANDETKAFIIEWLKNNEEPIKEPDSN
jgi:ankyrin repeat protein